MKRKRIILSSDIHLCHFDWYEMKAEERLQKWVDDLKAEYAKEPFEALLLLGDYSLDHWRWQIQGSYLTKEISNTERFVRQYLSQLKEFPIEIRMIAGNHEQYGEDLYYQLTGYHRKDVYVTGDWLFILMDTYQGGLDPTEHHDGVYTGADMDFIQKNMEKYPDKKVVLCCHFIDPNRESEEFKALLRREQIVCLAAGHTHRSEIWSLGDEFASKKVLFTGHYGESGEKDPTRSMWGFREMILTEHALESSYITPQSTIVFQEETITHPYAKQEYVKIETR